MVLLFTITLFFLLLISCQLPQTNVVGTTPTAIGKHCQTKCGNLTVQYPFGIGKACSLDESFELSCDLARKPPRLYISSGNLTIYSIADSEVRIFNSVAYQCYDDYGKSYNSTLITFKESSPFTFSQKNKFTVVGCDDYGWIRGPNGSDYASGCMGLCSNRSDLPNGNCSGTGCCETSIPKGFKYFDLNIGSFYKHVDVLSFNPCGFAFLGEENSFRIGKRHLSNVSDLFSNSYIPIVLDWVIGRGKRNCSQATECKGNSSCVDADIGGYRCTCNKGYEGNPYLGCQDINECEKNSTIPCYGHCSNTLGGYNCMCLQGHEGNATLMNGCRPLAKESKFPIVLSLALVLGLVAILFVGTIAIYYGLRKRKLIKLQKEFFELNGGMIMLQMLKERRVSESVHLFRSEQLRKATDNYSKERIVGQGGYGVVYKGILPDTRVVAIKKSTAVDTTQVKQFINEVFILTQVSHRHVVKLLGCCLEEKVPVLVYEFISNNTLFYHIHHESGGTSWLSWENRLRVATEAADAIAYLHSQASMCIIHRDVKSTNILLDENYATKISDFGSSRSVALNQADEVVTLVQGTVGYLDPEYFVTSQLTEKSDVYSFGVVLAELLTGKKPFCETRTIQEMNLAIYFVKLVRENRLSEIVEPRVLSEGTLDQLCVIAELIRRCLDFQGENRPTMREVATVLEGLKNSVHHPEVQQETAEESTSLTPEVEQSDLYGVLSIPITSDDQESDSGIVEMAVQEIKPHHA